MGNTYHIEPNYREAIVASKAVAEIIAGNPNGVDIAIRARIDHDKEEGAVDDLYAVVEAPSNTRGHLWSYVDAHSWMDEYNRVEQNR